MRRENLFSSISSLLKSKHQSTSHNIIQQLHIYYTFFWMKRGKKTNRKTWELCKEGGIWSLVWKKFRVIIGSNPWLRVRLACVFHLSIHNQLPAITYSPCLNYIVQFDCTEKMGIPQIREAKCMIDLQTLENFTKNLSDAMHEWT